MKNLKIGQLVSIPDRVCFPGRRDPYEWENGIVFAVNEKTVKVAVWNHFTKKAYFRNIGINSVKKVSYHHYVGEEQDFLQWTKTIKIPVGGKK
jgi:hypothetical protein